MPEVKLNVQLLDVTREPLKLIFAACRQCYSARFAGEVFSDEKLSLEQQAEFVKKIVASGHESPLEHVKFTFAVEGVSRALTHQLVRHRLASYSQQSQRYVKADKFDFILPPSIEQDGRMREEFSRLMAEIQRVYNRLLELYKDQGSSGEKANQDARFVLPQAAETKIVITMNCRELIHFFHQRCCERAQWEIKHLANRMLAICREQLPEVFETAGAKCEFLKYCPEGEKFSCGRYPPRTES